MDPNAPPLTTADIQAEAARLGEAVVQSGLPIRLMGGMAVWLRCPSVRRRPFARTYADIDFAAGSHDRRAVAAFFEREGYAGERLFNAIHGRDRLNFHHPSGRWTVDVIFDELRMSHRIDLRGRMNGTVPTLDLADLLLTKLQIWEINQKDLGDVICLLADHPLSASPAPPGSKPLPPANPDSVDLRRITALCASDWGLCHTVQRNLGLANDLAADRPLDHSACDPRQQIAELLAAIDAAPKTLGWRSRARIGERMRWYETPEEVRHET